MSRYYDDYRPGKFPNQKSLCEAIDPGNVPCLLQTDEANPLTIRLLVAAESADRLAQLIDSQSGNIQKAADDLQRSWGISHWPSGLDWRTEKHFYYGGSGIPMPEPHISDPRNLYSGASLPPGYEYRANRIEFTNGHEKAFPMAKAHIHVYTFFTNWGSILDRFADELNRLYGLKIAPHQIDWRKVITSSTLKKKHNDLSRQLCAFHLATASLSLRYRNRLAHDGLIVLEPAINGLTNRWEIRTQDDPDDRTSSANTDVLNLCQTALDLLIQHLDTCYGLMLAKLGSAGQPPW